MNNLKRVIEDQPCLLSELVAKSKVSPRILSYIVRYDYLPPKSVQNRIAKALKVSVREIWPVVEPVDQGMNRLTLKVNRG